MLEQMRELIDKLHLLRSGEHILCAVSGGADSVCLLHYLYHLREESGFHFTLSAAHFNHMLRGDAAAADAQFVSEFVSLCCAQQRLKDGSILPAVKLYSGRGDVGAAAQQAGAGIEETARRMRYDFLRETAKDIGASVIATAHNANDNAETMLFHLARGTGLQGLTGIAPVGNGLIRPLLTTPRIEIEDYLAYHALPHREDASNADERYARNRIRQQVVPVLEELFDGFVRRTADTAEYLRQDEQVLLAHAQSTIQKAQRLPDGSLSILAAEIAALEPAIAVRVVRGLLWQAAGGEQNFSAPHLQAVVRLCQKENPSAKIDLPKGLVARREYQQLVLSRRDETATEIPAPCALVAGEDLLWGSWRICCEKRQYKNQTSGQYEFWLACGQGDTLLVRTRAVGDTLKLKNRPEKSLKKWHIELKIPAGQRAVLPVIVNHGTVAAACGVGATGQLKPISGETAWHIIVKENR